MLSLQTQAEEETKNKLSSFADLLNALPGFEHSDFWTVIHKDSKVYFLDLALLSAPTIRTSVIVSTDLRIEVFFGETVMRNCGDVLVPEKIGTRLTPSSPGATAVDSDGTRRVVAAALALAAVAAVVYLVLAPPGSRRDDVLIGRNAAASRRATLAENNTENEVTEEDESGQGTETDTPDSDWIPAEEEARKLAADPVVRAPASSKGRRSAPHQNRNRRFVVPKSARRAAPSSELPAGFRAETGRPAPPATLV
ncbi:hypothetical protein HPB52_008180 [Rhipicephalus sanguineus]|uniref:Transmembrane protein n=1 Tax=Rhipicephalus sanguineus TaxID=34632 RepID=A0A9D4PXS0_RHISA|nr:hypothetical protein HPB52_008180 [Rhipicephalus sanguineus]